MSDSDSRVESTGDSVPSTQQVAETTEVEDEAVDTVSAERFREDSSDVEGEAEPEADQLDWRLEMQNDMDFEAIEAIEAILLRMDRWDTSSGAIRNNAEHSLRRLGQRSLEIPPYDEPVPVRSGLLFISLLDLGVHNLSDCRYFVEMNRFATGADGVNTRTTSEMYLSHSSSDSKLFDMARVTEGPLFQSSVGEKDNSGLVAFFVPQFYGNSQITFIVEEKTTRQRCAWHVLRHWKKCGPHRYSRSIALSNIIHAQAQLGTALQVELSSLSDATSSVSIPKVLEQTRDNWGVCWDLKFDTICSTGSIVDMGVTSPQLKVQLRYIDVASCQQLVNTSIRRSCTGASTGLATFSGVCSSGISSDSPANSCWLMEATELHQLCVPFGGDSSARLQMLRRVLMECARLNILEDALRQKCKYFPKDGTITSHNGGPDSVLYTAFELTLLNIGPRQVMSKSLCRLLLQRCGHWCFQGVKLNTRSPIHTAVQQNNVRCLLLILKFLNSYQQNVMGWEVSAARTPRSQSVLTGNGDTAHAQALERLTTMLNWLDDKGYAPTMLACCYRAQETTIVKRDVKQQAQERKDSLLILRLLVHFGGKLDAVHEQTKRTCLMMAIEHGNTHMVEWILNQKLSQTELRSTYHLQQPVHPPAARVTIPAQTQAQTQTQTEAAATATALPINDTIEVVSDGGTDTEQAVPSVPRATPLLIRLWSCVRSIARGVAALPARCRMSQATLDRNRSIQLIHARNRAVTHMQMMRCAPYAKDSGGNDALLVAIAHKRLEVIKLLMSTGSSRWKSVFGSFAGFESQSLSGFQFNSRNNAGDGVFHLAVCSKDFAVFSFLLEKYLSKYLTSLRSVHKYKLEMRQKICASELVQLKLLAKSIKTPLRSPCAGTNMSEDVGPIAAAGVVNSDSNSSGSDQDTGNCVNSWMHMNRNIDPLLLRNCCGLTPCALAERYIEQVEAELKRRRCQLDEKGSERTLCYGQGQRQSVQPSVAPTYGSTWSLDLCDMSVEALEQDLSAYGAILLRLRTALMEISEVKTSLVKENQALDHTLRLQYDQVNKTMSKDNFTVLAPPDTPAKHSQSLLRSVETAISNVATRTKHLSTFWLESVSQSQSQGQSLGRSKQSISSSSRGASVSVANKMDCGVQLQFPGSENSKLNTSAGTLVVSDEECKADDNSEQISNTTATDAATDAATALALALADNIDDEVDYAYGLVSKPNTTEEYFVNRYMNVREL